MKYCKIEKKGWQNRMKGRQFDRISTNWAMWVQGMEREKQVNQGDE